MTAEGPVGVECEHGSAYQRVQYSHALLQEIRRRATDQFLAIPRGGLEVGGVLYGTRGSGEVTLLGHRELQIEYLSGPSFSLSPKDESVLAEMVAAEAPAGPDGQTLSVVGWWHSHTRSDVSLSGADLDLHQRFFPEAAAVALIIRPFKFDPAQIAVYAPNQDGYRSCCRFTMQDAAVAVPVAPAPLAPAPIRETEAEPAPPPAPSAPSRGRTNMRRPALAAGVALLCLAAAAFAVLRPYREPEPVRLDVTDTSRGLVVHWNTPNRTISSAAWAELLIKDGTREPRAVSLRSDDLHSGTITYMRKSEKVEVRLRVRSRDGGVEEAVAHFIGGPPTVANPPVAEVSRDEEQPAPEWNRVQEQVDRLNLELKRLQTPAPAPAVKDPVVTRARTMAAVIPPPRPVATPAPVLTTAPAIQAPVISPSGSVSLPVTIPSAPPPVPKPQSGRAIWTGNLPRGATLAIENRRASMGDLNGRMPTRESRVRVYAGELRESGLVVYTASGQERVEPPSAANGWNLTTFRPDPRRSRELTVLEAPSEKNGWQRLMVRTERPASVLIIEWEETGN